MPSEIFWPIVGALVGIIIGGAGGQALVRRAVGNVIAQPDNSAVAASSAAATAASTAATAVTSLTQHVGRLQESVDKQWDTLDKIREEQTKMSTAFAQFRESYPELCKLKHDSIDREQNRMQTEIDQLQRA